MVVIKTRGIYSLDHEVLTLLFSPLILGDPQQLHSPPLVGSESHDLPDQIADEFVVLGELSLGLAGTLLQGVGGGFVAFVEADDHFVSGSHGDWEGRRGNIIFRYSRCLERVE